MKDTDESTGKSAKTVPDAALQSILHTNLLCLLVVDPENGKIVSANQAARRYYGYAGQEFMRLNIADIVVLPPPEVLARLHTIIHAGGACYRVRHRLKNNEVHEVQEYWGVVAVNDRPLLYALVTDLAERKEMIGRMEYGAVQQALPNGTRGDANHGRKASAAWYNVSENKYRAVFETNATAMIILNDENIIMLANSKFTEYFGYERDEVEGKMSIYTIICPTEWERIHGYRKRRIAQDPIVPREYECRALDKKRNAHYALVEVSYLEDEKQSIISILDITERKKIETRHRENEEHLRLLIENVKDVAVFMLNKDGAVASWNDGAERVSGYSQHDVLGKNLSSLYCTDSQSTKQYQLLLSAVMKKRHAEWDGWWVRKNGAWFWAHVAVSSIRDERGEIGGFTVFLQDITEAKRTEGLLREREELYRTLIETSPEALILFDANGRIMMVNQKAMRLFGYRNREDSFGENVYNCVIPEERQRAMGNIARLRLGLSNKNHSYTCLRRDGTRFSGLISSSVVMSGEDDTKCYVIMIMDVTEQKMAERRIRNAAEEWRVTFDSLPEFIFLTDTAKRITRINKTCAEAYGAKPKDLIGKYAYEVFGKEKDESFRGLYQKALKQRKNITAEYYNSTLQRHEEVTVSLIYNNDGKCIGSVHVAKDITERKRINDILQKEKEAIEQLANERTKELVAARLKLEQSKRLSDIGTLAATVAHELRNPLGVIRTAVYNIRRKNQNDALLGHLANIDKKILESDQIITNLLYYSRIKIPHLERVRLCALLDDCIASARDRFRRWNVTIDGRCRPIIDGYLDADPLQITELFNNIINNAFESLPDKKGNIRVSGGYDGNGHIWISVADNGIGIEPADLERLTEPFFTKKSKGTGLGLSVCKQIVELHEGHLYIESQKGQGTTVTISLPIRSLQEGDRVNGVFSQPDSIA